MGKNLRKVKKDQRDVQKKKNKNQKKQVQWKNKCSFLENPCCGYVLIFF
jgi:hypothetical protein